MQKYGAIFFNRTAMSWFYQVDKWAGELAGEEFEAQKSSIDQENILE